MDKFYTDKQQIINWLDKYEISNYILIPDKQYEFIVNVNSNVNLFKNNLTHIPVKFNEVSGDFYCDNNQLTSLEFSPQTVGSGFYCHSNKLTSLEFCPQAVSGIFYCSDNQLTSLEFCPQTVSDNFYCNYNKLTSLEFCPQMVIGNFYCENNPELKEIQEINNFKLIYLEHKKILIAKFSDKLESDLINYNSKKTAKIKI